MPQPLRTVRDLLRWSDRAYCRDVDPDMFFPDTFLDQRATVQEYCARCPVMVECREFALTAGIAHGVWGGATESERRRLTGPGDLGGVTLPRIGTLGLMRAVIAHGVGDPDVLSVSEVPDPAPGPGEVVIAVTAAGLNRADLMQRRGFYPPPAGASEIVGMECSGTIVALGEGVGRWSVGDEVCALLAGGGYAERVAVPEGQVMPVPAGVDLVSAAALPEVACTVWSNVFMVGGLRTDETLLVHGGAGGIGSCAIQLAHAAGARVLATAGTPEKRELCLSLGADLALDYHDDWVTQVQDEGGADVVLDNMGAKYLMPNVSVLREEGRLVVIGLQGGTKAELDLNGLLRKRAAVIATNLRGRPVEGKSAICASVVEHVWPRVAAGDVRPVIGAVLPLEQVADAHRLMESGSHTGKILLTVDQ